MTRESDKEFALEEKFQRAVAFHERGMLNKAELLYGAILKADPSNIGSLHNLGILCIQQGKYDDAAKFARKTLRHQPDLALAHNTLGVALRHLGRLGEAEVCCREALRLAPGYAEAYNNLSDTLIALGRYGEAEHCCRESLRVKADYTEAHINLGNALGFLGRVEEAEICFREALRLRPRNPAAYNNLGNVLIRRGKLVEAGEALGHAAALRPDDADALATWFHLKQRICDWSDYRESEAKIRKGVRRQPLAGMAFNLLGISSTAEQQFAYARQVAATLAVPASAKFPDSLPKSGERLRLGCGVGGFPAKASVGSLRGLRQGRIGQERARETGAQAERIARRRAPGPAKTDRSR